MFVKVRTAKREEASALDNVKYLLDYFLPEVDESRGGALDDWQMMHIFSRNVSYSGFQTGIGRDFGVHHTKVCKA